ncbi:MAG TPA: HD domain-containing protein [Vulgatibacter sp.]|nr:HD domain-containing protein [Vulgatibacter sp.]
MEAIPEGLSAFSPPPALRRVLAGLRGAGYEAFLVGGAVRDLACGAPSGALEFDLATDAHPDRVAALFGRVVDTGISHGTVTVVEDGQAFEVTTYRGRRPERGAPLPRDVGTMEEDLSKRDFTINAMAYDPMDRRLLDLHGGRRDLAAGVVRAVGDPDERFAEDPLRTMRACRFAARFGFRVDRATRRAIPRHLEAFRDVAVERIQGELSKILVSAHPRYGIELLRGTGLLRVILPELLEGLGMRQNRWHRYDVYHHVLHAVQAARPDLVVRLATLLHDVSKPATAAPSDKAPGEFTFYSHEVDGARRAREIGERLRFPAKVIDEVALLVREHQFVYTDEWSDAAVRRMLARVGEERFDALLAVREADIRGRGIAVEEGLENLAALERRVAALRSERPALRIRDLALDGRDVMRILGLGPSPLVGEALQHLLGEVLESPEANTPESLEARLRAWWRDRSSAEDEDPRNQDR